MGKHSKVDVDVSQQNLEAKQMVM